MKNYYDILGVSINAINIDIKNAYKKMVLKHHPDKGGDNEKFQKIKKAYDVLRNEEKKKLYDVRLRNTLKKNEEFFKKNEDFFKKNEEFFKKNDDFGDFPKKSEMKEDNDSSSSEESNVPNKVELATRSARIYPNINKKLDVTLSDIINHRIFRIKIDRVRQCALCYGKGVKNFQQKYCIVCDGKGVYPSGVGINIPRWCEHCYGSGLIKIESYQHLCENCNGKGLIKDQKIVNINSYHCIHNSLIKNCRQDCNCCESIPRVIFRGEGNHLPNTTSGNIIIELNELADENYKRIGLDLIFEKYITMYDAIFGLEFKLPSLTKTNENDVDLNVSLKRMLDNEGMLSNNWFTQKLKKRGVNDTNGNIGDIIVKFKVIVPDIKSDQDQQVLKKIFLTSSSDDRVNLEKVENLVI